MTIFHSIFIALNFLVTAPPSAEKIGHTSISYEVKQNGCDAELIVTATIDDGWYIYSQNQPDSDGPVATSFTFTPSENYKLVGKTEEGKPKSKFMEGFGSNYNIFQHSVVFKQKIKVIGKKDFTIKGEMEFMQCDEVTCLPPEYPELSFKLKGCAAGTDIKEEIPEVVKDTAKTNPEIVVSDTTGMGDSIMPVTWTVYSKKYNDTEYEVVLEAIIDSGWILSLEKENPGKLSFDFKLSDKIKKDGEIKLSKAERIIDKFLGYRYKFSATQKLKVDTKDSLELTKVNINVVYNVISDDGKKIGKLKEETLLPVNLNEAEEMNKAEVETSFWGIFILAFFSGFIALLTPCVFPMIPMTVSFFLKSSKNRAKAISNAMIYGASIVIIYVTIGLIITGTLGASSLNELATNVTFNILFFVMLVVFGISFLGAFEITLPSKWVNAADKNADRGGLIGIFFMAATLGLVSFSCTGPIIGTQLVIAAEQGGMGPFFAMLGFSLAIAIPFTLFAIFPGWLNSMPSSGGWLNTVKVSLGFLEIALALKFLSKADLVTQSHWLERELFIGLWIAIFILWGLYLLGIFKTSHDSEVTHLGVGRIFMATLVFSFAFYLVPGLWGAPLKLISGIAPPMHYSESPYGVNGKAPDIKLPEHASFGPHGLVTFHDYQHGLDYAKKIGKPIMIDFTGHGCENCRKMEESVWSNEEVKAILKDSLVIISLHVDEKIPLPEGSNITNKDGKKLRYTGQIWAAMEQEKYGEVSQPLYVLIDHNEEMLVDKASYQSHGSVAAFKPWLEEGVKKFEARKRYKKTKPVMYTKQLAEKVD